MSAIVIKIREKKLIKKFLKAGAVSAENAVDLVNIGVKQTPLFMKMCYKKIIVEAKANKFYINTTKL